jgi:hypothetical protein
MKKVIAYSQPMPWLAPKADMDYLVGFPLLQLGHLNMHANARGRSWGERNINVDDSREKGAASLSSHGTFPGFPFPVRVILGPNARLIYASSWSGLFISHWIFRPTAHLSLQYIPQLAITRLLLTWILLLHLQLLSIPWVPSYIWAIIVCLRRVQAIAWRSSL